MAETFYTALEVGDDADAEAIRRAYREQVKRYHPDVSDDPGAPREFNRLTTARDVLVDETERDRYDRLGHATYVQRHLESSAWGGATQSGTDTDSSASATSSAGPAGGESAAAAAEQDTGNPRQRHRATDTGDYDRSAWLGDDWERSTTARERRHASAPSGAATSTRSTGDASWQHASEAYRYQPSSVPTERPTARSRLRRVFGSVGPWLVVHLVFIGGAIGTAWYVTANTGLVGHSALPAMAFGILLVGLTVLLSAMHVVSLLYG